MSEKILTQLPLENSAGKLEDSARPPQNAGQQRETEKKAAGQKCSVVKCDRGSYSRGYCKGHWQQWSRTGLVPTEPIGPLVKHGLSASSEYKIWTGMRQRCENPKHIKYKRYGGRWITVCERWKLFDNFLADMGFRPNICLSIERVNNNGNYEPGNCKWATRKEQQRNMASNHLIEFNGRSMTLVAWAEEVGLKPSVIHGRIWMGWTIKETLTTPLQP